MGSLAVLLLSSCKSIPPSFVIVLLQQLVGEAAESEDESLKILKFIIVSFKTLKTKMTEMINKD